MFIHRCVIFGILYAIVNITLDVVFTVGTGNDSTEIETFGGKFDKISQFPSQLTPLESLEVNDDDRWQTPQGHFLALIAEVVALRAVRIGDFLLLGKGVETFLEGDGTVAILAFASRTRPVVLNTAEHVVGSVAKLAGNCEGSLRDIPTKAFRLEVESQMPVDRNAVSAGNYSWRIVIGYVAADAAFVPRADSTPSSIT